MKVPVNSSYKIAYSVQEHPHLGVLISAYVIQITSGGNWSMVNQKLNASSAEDYQAKSSKNDLEAIRILDEIKPEFLIRKFSPVKRIRPREYFEKHFDKKVFQNLIRPFIDAKIVEAIKFIHGKPLFISEGKNPIHKEIFWSDELATVLFHYRKNDDNTHYFATLKHEGQRLNIYHSSLLLSNYPCYAIVHDKIMLVENVEGTKISSFFKKRFIAIPKSSEKSYFQKFGINIIEKYNVYAVGYQIHTKKYQASPVLVLSKLLNGRLGFLLKFRYGKNEFYFDRGKKVSVRMLEKEGELEFHRIKRSIIWEQGVSDKISEIGLNHLNGAEYQLNGVSDMEGYIHFISEFKELFEELNFEIRQELDQVYELEKSQIEFHIEEGIDWFDVKAKVKLGEFEIPFKEIIPYIKDMKVEFPLPNGKFAILPKEWLAKLNMALDFSNSSDELKLKKYHLGLLSQIEEIGPDKSKVKSLESFEGIKDAPLPINFKGTLRDYQKAGYDWFYFLKEYGFGGCLADDMGLGKTVQTLALLQNEREIGLRNSNNEVSNNGQQSLFSEQKSAYTSLLIVPTSLAFNWLGEAKKFTPDLKILIHSGTHRNKDTSLFSQFDLVLSTYGTLRNDIDFLKDFKFHYVILDESQFIKNANSKIAKAVSSIHASYRLNLTGTPIENSINDLWSQINFLNKGLLGNQAYFQKNYVNDIEKKQDQKKAEALQSIIKPFVLRRTKSQVAKELPEKTEKIIYCEMTPDQQKKYEEVKSKYRNMILGEIEAKGLGKTKINLLQGLMKLRQIANHPKFVDEKYDGGSGKFEETTLTIPTAIKEGHKILVFSSFVKHLQIFVDYSEQENIPYCYIDGSTSANKRKEEVEKFQSDPNQKIFFISLKAGGFGLNLTEADYVFILDPWWNPASERQAIDRTHRIGQTKKVFTYKYITVNTVEEKILALQNNKKSLSDALIKTEESFVKKLDINDIKSLLE